ncbi:MAG TPA: radical SAM protein, partial [bacterium]|nr:radical SAM protein [bacterium]
MQTLRNRTFLPLKFYFDKKVRKLNFIFFELTQKCNLSCVHCGSDCNKDNNSADLPADVILKTLIDVKKKYDSHNITIVLSGGEPTIYPGVWDLGKKIIDLEFPWGMVTNGLSWDEKTIKKAKESRMHSVTVSIDGLEENHNWFRGNPKSFRKAKNALKMILETPEIYKKDVVTVINRRNLNELDDIYEMLKKMGLKRWRLTGVDPIGRAK